MRLGTHHSQETKNKLSIAAERQYQNPDARAQMSAVHKGKPLSEGHKHKISDSLKGSGHPFYGRHHTFESRQKMSQTLESCWQNPRYRQQLSITRKSLWQDPEYRDHQAKARGEEWRKKISSSHIGARNPMYGRTGNRNPAYGKKHSEDRKARTIRATLAALRVKPNKVELRLQNILNFHFPDNWKYVGDGQFIIGGCCPDFLNVNGKKHVIELFGNYWHPIFDVAKKKEHYHRYGYRVTIVWDDELKDEAGLVKRLRRELH